MHKQGKKIDWEYGEYPHFAWVYILRGKGVLTDNDGNKHYLRPGMVFLRRTDRKMSLEIDPESDWAECFISLKFCKTTDSELINRLSSIKSLRTSWVPDINHLRDSTPEVLQFLHALPKEAIIYEHGVDETLIDDFSKLCQYLKSCDTDEPTDMILKAISLIKTVTQKKQLRAVSSNERFIHNITQRLSENISSRIPVPELLDGIGLGYSRIRSLFKKATGLSPGEYRIQRRIEVAGKMLRNNRSVKDVATQLGYKDQFTFATQFRKYTGMAPTEFRK